MTWYEVAEKLDPHEAAARCIAGWLEYARARRAGDEKREAVATDELDVCWLAMTGKGEDKLYKAAEALGCMIFDALNPEVAALRQAARERMKANGEGNPGSGERGSAEKGETDGSASPR
jgi:hypothetical protein